MMVSLISRLYYLWGRRPVYLSSGAISLNKDWRSPHISQWLYGALSQRLWAQWDHFCSQSRGHTVCTVCVDGWYCSCWLTLWAAFLSTPTGLFVFFHYEQLVVGICCFFSQPAVLKSSINHRVCSKQQSSKLPHPGYSLISYNKLWS